MKKAILISVLSFFACMANAQVANLDFESWYTDTLGHLRLHNWEHLVANSSTPNSGFFATWRDSVAQHGVYALTLSRWYNYDDDWVRQRASTSSRPSRLNGYYEYTDDTLAFGSAAYDTALVEVFLTKWNSAVSGEDTIGSGIIALPFNPVYTAFSCPVSYMNSNIPDSITINIFPTKCNPVGFTGNCLSGGKCSYLTIDNLSVESPSEIALVAVKPFLFYPNPVQHTLFVKTNAPLLQTKTLQALLTDCLGRVVWNQPVNQAVIQINMDNIVPGNYFVIFKDGEGIIQVDKITRE